MNEKRTDGNLFTPNNDIYFLEQIVRIYKHHGHSEKEVLHNIINTRTDKMTNARQHCRAFSLGNFMSNALPVLIGTSIGEWYFFVSHLFS